MRAAADTPIMLVPRQLTAAEFAAYGEVIELRSTARRCYAGHAFAHDGASGAPSLWISCPPGVARGTQRLLRLERHPHATQTFVPIEAGRYLVVVCDAAGDGSPDLATLRAWIATEQQGITYYRNVWHHGLTVLDARTRFAVVMATYGTGQDDVFVDVAVPVDVVLPPSDERQSEQR